MDWFERALIGRLGLSVLCGVVFLAISQTFGFVLDQERNWQTGVALSIAFGLWCYLRYPVWRRKGELDGIFAAARPNGSTN
jgi:hypothetical protein